MTDDSNEVNNIDGIPIVNIKDIVAPVYKYFNLNIGDEQIMDKASEYLEELAFSDNLEKMRSYLWRDLLLNVGNMKLAVIYGSKNLDRFQLLEARTGKEDSDRVELPTTYGRWIAAQGRLILEILKRTKEEDAVIQHWLNYEDFILELSLTETGCKVISEIYDLRGLDFFLFHYVGGETSAIKDKALFDNAKKIPIALRRMARMEEATQVEKDIESRLKGLIKISNQFGPREQTQSETDFVLEKLKLKAERFWNDYLSPDVWKALHNDSRTDLIDAFISEIFLKNGILYGWSIVVLSLCKVIEREMSLSLFWPWIDIIRKSSFSEPLNATSSKIKKIQTRKITFEMLKKCATEPIQPPTIGQLIFIAKFWNDSIMDECTNLFKDIRTNLEKYCDDSTKSIEKLVLALEEKHSPDGESANIVDLRNASAHPGREGSFTWSKYLTWLKTTIGQPPEYILRVLIFKLRPPLNKIYQDKLKEADK